MSMLILRRRASAPAPAVKGRRYRRRSRPPDRPNHRQFLPPGPPPSSLLPTPLPAQPSRRRQRKKASQRFLVCQSWSPRWVGCPPIPARRRAVRYGNHPRPVLPAHQPRFSHFVYYTHRRRHTEEKAKVVAAALWNNWFNSLPHYSYFVLGWFEGKDALKKWPVHTKPSHHSPKVVVLPNQQRWPLPSLLYLSYDYMYHFWGA